MAEHNQDTSKGPHEGGPLISSGAPLEAAKAAVVLVHGRGATAENILGLTKYFEQPGIAYMAPQATGNSWYPRSFLAPLEENEPGLSSALRVIGDLVAGVERHNIAADKVVLLGFSQGACLVLEFAARHAKRYGAVIALSGGLIGPAGTPRDYSGSLGGAPVFLGCGDMDSHIPVDRVHETTEVMRLLGANVTERIYPSMGHGINEDELIFVRQLLESLA
jgi:predicted esterase